MYVGGALEGWTTGEPVVLEVSIVFRVLMGFGTLTKWSALVFLLLLHRAPDFRSSLHTAGLC